MLGAELSTTQVSLTDLIECIYSNGAIPPELNFVLLINSTMAYL